MDLEQGLEKNHNKENYQGAHLGGGGSRRSGPLPFFDTVQVGTWNAETNLKETLWKIESKNTSIHQNDVPTAFSGTKEWGINFWETTFNLHT